MMRLISGVLATGLMLVVPTIAYADDNDWAGIYAGVEAGGSSGRLNTTGSDSTQQLSNIFVPGRGIVVVPGTTVPSDGSKTSTNFVYGGLLGGQWQTGKLILGIEGDLHGARDFSGFTTSVVEPSTILAPASNVTISRSARTSYDWSVRARIGAAIGSRTMIYASGGIAGARVRLTGQDSFTTPAGAAATGGNTPAFISPMIGPVVITSVQQRDVIGWTGGFGGEIKLSKRIGIGLDARHTDYGTHDFALAGACTVSAFAGACAGTTRTSPPIVVNGTTLNPATDVTPGSVPSSTRASFRDIRLAARVVFHF